MNDEHGTVDGLANQLDAKAAKVRMRKEARAVRAAAALQGPGACDMLARYAGDLPPASVVGLYMPIRDELDPRPLALATGAALALPATDGTAMTFVSWIPGDPLEKSAFGVPEPNGEEVVPDLLLIPLLAFDVNMNRLGYGAGHYDRYIARHPMTLRFGVAYAAQQRDDIIVEPHDMPLHGIITEQGLLRA
ncbi:MAG: 5-formyltetrahydrofolate cyclo-ligase [Pseudomonadota bacterium]